MGEGEVARKKNSADFVLWKPELDGVGWAAPFGKGRPGWHIECSAMAKAVLTDGTDSDTIDIHCGGVDLKFPHHENEIAQSNCSHDAPLANYWVHNEFLNMGDEKMSKSLGNVKLIHDLLKDWDGEVIRLALLTSGFGEELLWSETLLSEAKLRLDYWYRLYQTRLEILEGNWEKDPSLFAKQPMNQIKDNLSTPRFLAEFDKLYRSRIEDTNMLQDLIDESGRVPSGMSDILSQFVNSLNFLGLLQKDPDEWFRGGLDYDTLVAEYDEVRAQALAAKEAGDKAAMGQYFKRSDEIRDKFKSEGVVIESGAGGKSSWRKA